MINQEIRDLFNDVYNIFWTKWRDQELFPDSDEWDVVVRETGVLMDKYSRKADTVILWFLDELDKRCRNRVREENGSGS